MVPVQSQWYELQDDYYIPCLILSEEETQPIGLWGQRHKQYLKEHKHLLYTTMLIEGTLNSYLADIDKQAQERLLLLTKQIAEQENVTEQLKADNAMLWVQKMNEIQSRVREIIYNEIIFVVTKQQINVVAAIQGMAATVGNARLCLNTVTHRPSQNMCIRYMP